MRRRAVAGRATVYSQLGTNAPLQSMFFRLLKSLNPRQCRITTAEWFLRCVAMAAATSLVTSCTAAALEKSPLFAILIVVIIAVCTLQAWRRTRRSCTFVVNQKHALQHTKTSLREGRAATRSVVCVIVGIVWPVFGQTWFDARSVKSISYYLKSSAVCPNWKNSRITGNGIVAFRAVAL